MNNGRFVGIVGGALLGAVVVAQSAQALPPYPERATVYQVKFARAMDECTSGFVTVVSGINGCPQANTDTDQGLTSMSQGNLKVSRRSRNGAYIRFTARGLAPAGTKVAVQMTLRVTNTLGAPAGSKTYEDFTIMCGDTVGSSCGNYTTVTSRGRAVLRQGLNDCLAANGLSAARFGVGNIEIIDSALRNCDTGQIAGTPGILQQ